MERWLDLIKGRKRSKFYGPSLLQVEETSSKMADYTDLTEVEILRVNQDLFGFYHPEYFEMSYVNTFVRVQLNTSVRIFQSCLLVSMIWTIHLLSYLRI